MTADFRIQWYPGHMAKARRLLASLVKQADFVVEVADARAPFTTRNPDIDELIAERPRLLLLTKEDLAEPETLSFWVKYYQDQGLDVITASLVDSKGIDGARSRLHAWIDRVKQRRKGAPAPALSQLSGLRLPKTASQSSVRRGIVLGIPNTGKSTLIRSLGAKNVATGARAGVTRSLQWINVAKGVQLLDSPGLLWPRLETGSVALKLAWLGSVGDGAYDREAAALGLIEWMMRRCPSQIAERYDLQQEGESTPAKILRAIAARRGLLESGGQPDIEQAADALLWDLRKGRLGKVALDDPVEPQ